MFKIASDTPVDPGAQSSISMQFFDLYFSTYLHNIVLCITDKFGQDKKDLSSLRYM